LKDKIQIPNSETAVSVYALRSCTHASPEKAKTSRDAYTVLRP
jgi:hypothetical protein